MKRVHLDDLDYGQPHYTQLQDVSHWGKPFTGIGYDDGEDEHTEYPFVDGCAHGVCQTKYNNGQLRVEFTAEEGNVVGVEREWYQNGQLKMTVELGDDPRTEIWESHWTEAGILTYERTPQHIRTWDEAGTPLKDTSAKSTTK